MAPHHPTVMKFIRRRPQVKVAAVLMLAAVVSFISILWRGSEGRHDDARARIAVGDSRHADVPAGETGDPLLAKIPAPPNAASVSIGAAPDPAARCPKDQSPCTTSEPLATVVRDVVTEVTRSRRRVCRRRIRLGGLLYVVPGGGLRDEVVRAARGNTML